MPAIAVQGVSKKFRLNHDPAFSIKERAMRFGRKNVEDFWALKGIDFEVPEGQSVGMLGHNGSGKSTLLKCIAGILLPTTGEIRLKGRLASLLELGAGFHPELTGRENVFINASFLGISRQEIERKFDDIVAFAELEQFIDNQVKFYSSGMYVRLGFAVAVTVDPDVLLIDEVLAVGDEVFQAKCLEKIREFQREGRTILFVTHAADLVREICDRAIVLHHGDMVADGPPGESIRIFREHLHGAIPETSEAGQRVFAGERDRRIKLTQVTMEYPGHLEGRFMTVGDPLWMRVGYEAVEPVEGSVLNVQIFDNQGRVLFNADTEMMGVRLPPLDGAGEIVVHIAYTPLLDGEFPVRLVLKDASGQYLDWKDPEEQSFEVVNPGRMSGQVAFPITAWVMRDGVQVPSA